MHLDIYIRGILNIHDPKRIFCIITANMRFPYVPWSTRANVSLLSVTILWELYSNMYKKNII